MATIAVIECPDCRGRIVCEAQALRAGLELSCPVCDEIFPCGSREIRQALRSLADNGNPRLKMSREGKERTQWMKLPKVTAGTVEK